MRDHLLCAWDSPYLVYICRVRCELGMQVLPMTVPRLYRLMNIYFVDQTNAEIARCSLPWVAPVKRLKKQNYVMEGVPSSTIAKFKFSNAELGNRYPRPGHVTRKVWCPLCPAQTKNTEPHVTFFCFAVEELRKTQTSFSSFRNMGRAKDFSDDHIF